MTIAHSCPKCSKNLTHLHFKLGEFSTDFYKTEPGSKGHSLYSILLLLKTSAEKGVPLEDVKYTCSHCEHESTFLEGATWASRDSDYCMRNTAEVIQGFKKRYTANMVVAVTEGNPEVEESLRIRAEKYRCP